MRSGEPILVGGDNLGPLASGGVSSVPIGCDNGVLDLVTGKENGWIYYFSRENLHPL